MAEHPEQIHLSPYQYGLNNLIKNIDPDGRCVPCLIYATEALTYVAAAALAVVSTCMIVNSAKQISNNGNFYSSTQDNTSVSKPKLQPILKTKDGSKSADKTEQTESNSDNTYNRVKVRKGTKEKVAENQPRNKEGQMLDPERTDLGHKPGNEWRTRKEQHKAKGSTRKEVIEAENNPYIYQYEDRSSNRSRKNEKKS